MRGSLNRAKPALSCPVIRFEELIKDTDPEEGDREWIFKKATLAVAKSYNDLTT